MKNYILNGKEAIPVDDILEWAKWFGTANRIVRSDMINGVHISTVFLGVDHGYSFGEPIDPVLFETMIFGGDNDGYQDRYSTWSEAEQGHEKAIRIVNGGNLIESSL